MTSGLSPSQNQGRKGYSDPLAAGEDQTRVFHRCSGVESTAGIRGLVQRGATPSSSRGCRPPQEEGSFVWVNEDRCVCQSGQSSKEASAMRRVPWSTFAPCSFLRTPLQPSNWPWPPYAILDILQTVTLGGVVKIVSPGDRNPFSDPNSSTNPILQDSRSKFGSSQVETVL